jgi:hypothetical protein
MVNAKELNEIAKNFIEEERKGSDENIKKVVEFFTKDLKKIAEKGRFEKKTTCLIKKDKYSYHCQTENDGGGFLVENIFDVIREIRKLGFEVHFKVKKGYCPLDISWRTHSEESK